MIPTFKSGKFWLKLLCYGGLLLSLLVLAAYAGGQYLFSQQRIQAAADAALAGTGYQIRFDQNIRRRWLPRPTVVLTQVRISRPGGAADLDIGSMHIGLAWSSLLGQPAIEKWVWQDSQLRLYRTASGEWNTDALLNRQPSSGATPLNRLVLRNFNLSIRDQNLPEQRFTGIDADWNNLSGAQSPFTAEGRWQTSGRPEVAWQASGSLINSQPRQWQDVRLEWQAKLPHLGATRSQWQFNGIWQPHNSSLLLQQVQWQWQSDTANLNLSGSGSRWQVGSDLIDIPQASVLLSARNQEVSGNATLLLNRLQWRHQTGQLGHFQINGGWQTSRHQTLVSSAGSLLWLANHSWRLDDWRLSSHQDNLNGLPNPRWLSELGGHISGQGLQMAKIHLNGQFDGQPLTLDADYSHGEQQRLSGRLNLQQLSLRPYWQVSSEDAPADLHAVWQRWLQGRQTDWHIDIGRIQTPFGQLENFRSHLQLDQQRLRVEDMTADLYQGRSRGWIQVDNQPQPLWQIEQAIEQVQIKPLLQDAFNFHNFDGQGDARFHLSARGWRNPDWAATLNGEARLSLRQGSLRGIDLNNILQRNHTNATTLAFNEQSHTRFDRFDISLPVANGVADSRHTRLSAPSLDLEGAGKVDFVRQQIDYQLRLNTLPQRPGSVPLPLKISGALARPGFTLDFQRLTDGLETPEQKQEALRQTLRRQWQWLNQGNRAASSP